MPRVSLVGGGHGGAEDYATISLWWASESGVNYGSKIEAECSGGIGGLTILSGVTPHGYEAYAKSGEEFDGTNAGSCPFFTNYLNIQSPNGIFRGLSHTSTSTSNAPIRVRAANITIDKFIVSNFSGNEGVTLNTADAGKMLSQGVILCNGRDYGVRLTSSAYTFDCENLLIEGAAVDEFAYSNSTTPVNAVNLFCTGAGGNYSTIGGQTVIFTTCASQSLTVPSAITLTGFTTAELVDFAGGDYRTKLTSTLATAGTGSQSFIGAFLETSSGISLTVDSGTYLQAGTNTLLKAELKILTTSGSYLLTGSDVNLKAAKKLIAETGSYNLTGTDVTLTYTPGGGGETLVIDSGVYSLAGDELLLSTQLNIISNSGNYSLSGTETRIAYNANIVINAGNYSLTSSNINLFANYGMIVQSTSYTLTGKSVALRYSGDTNQVIGTVTAGFAPDLYSVGYKPNTITVNFKE